MRSNRDRAEAEARVRSGWNISASPTLSPMTALKCLSSRAPRKPEGATVVKETLSTSEVTQLKSPSQYCEAVLGRRQSAPNPGAEHGAKVKV